MVVLASRGVLTRPALRPITIRCSASPDLQTILAGPVTTLLADEEVAEITVVDTVLDLAVYGLLFGVVALTVYSLYVTLDQSNKDYGGWTKPVDEVSRAPSPTQAPERLRKGARYDPATDQWTYPTEQERALEAKSSGQVVSDSNRYERRAEKKQRKKRRAEKRK